MGVDPGLVSQKSPLTELSSSRKVGGLCAAWAGTGQGPECAGGHLMAMGRPPP